jgi:hypothetical protein
MSVERSGREPDGDSCVQGPEVYPVARHGTHHQGTAQLTESVKSQLVARCSTLPVQALHGVLPVRALAFHQKPRICTSVERAQLPRIYVS